MKRKILIISLPIFFAGTTCQAAEIYNQEHNKLELYGKMVGEHYFSTDHTNDGDKSYVRFGLKGETQINPAMTGYGQWEYNVPVGNPETDENSSDANTTRLGFAGLGFGQYGTLDYGRNYSISYDVLSWTDMLPEFGGNYAVTDTLTGRSTSLLTYRNHDFFGVVPGLDFALQYQGSNPREEAKVANGNGFGISTSYQLNSGLGVIAAYQQQNRTDRQKQQAFGKGSLASVWALGLKYDANQLYLATTFTEGQRATPIMLDTTLAPRQGVANKTQNIEVVAQYQFDFGLRPSLAYIQTKAKDLEQIGSSDLNKYIDIGASYYFNKNMATFIDYKANLLKGSNKLNLATADILAVGFTYQF